jgi:hypothetical protein
LDLNSKDLRDKVYPDANSDSDEETIKGLRAYLEKDVRTYKTIDIQTMLA